MKLKSITVYGLFNSYNHHIELKEEGLTFIHAKNGAGKSTTLKMIYDFFTGDLVSLAEVPFNSMVVKTTDGIEIKIDGETLETTRTDNNIDKYATLEDVVNLYRTIYISPERNIIIDADGHIRLAIEEYANEFRNMLEYAREHSRLIPVKAEENDISDSDFLFLCKNLKARLDFISDIGISVNIPEEYNFPPSRYEYCERKEQYSDLVQSVSNLVDDLYPIAESVIMFMDIINSLFTNKKIYIEDGLKPTVKLNTGNAIPLNKLSAGEKQILIMFYRLIFHTAKDTLAIVDEPEISLHISWQQKLAELFLEISQLKDMQILVATHAPQVIHDRWDLAYELRTERA